MKQLLCAAGAIALCLALCGCGGKQYNYETSYNYGDSYAAKVDNANVIRPNTTKATEATQQETEAAETTKGKCRGYTGPWLCKHGGTH